MRFNLTILSSMLLILTAADQTEQPIQSSPEAYMKIAITAADKAGNPFGSVIVNEKGEYVSAGNSVKTDGPTAHAEMNAIWKLKELNYEDASELTLYTSAEPCSMCMSAIIWAGIPRVVFGMPIDGISRYYNQIQLSAEEVAQKSWYDIEIVGPMMEEECTELFEKFN